MNPFLRTHIFVFVVLLLSMAMPGFAMEHSGETVVDTATRLQQKYDQLTSLSFHFTQDTRGNLSGRPRRASGQAFFLKTEGMGKMRWNYLSPDEQVLISDGTTLIMYFAKLQQLIRTPATALQQDITYSFFSGKGNIVDDFQIQPPDPRYASPEDEESAFKVIKLVPISPQSQVRSIHVWISNNSLIQRIELEDHFDTLTLLNFSDLRLNQLPAANQQAMEGLFSFTPPDGTEIINQ